MKLAFWKIRRKPVGIAHSMYSVKRRIVGLKLLINDYEKDLLQIPDSDKLAQYFVRETIYLITNELQTLERLIAR